MLLQAGIDFVTNNSKKGWRKESDRRIEMPDYPERAVLEGIVNALIHRSYTELGSEVHIDMFDDRIEIYSPGGMVGGISLKDRDILKIPSKRRNPILADIFSRLKYMERRGSGFKKILSDYEKQENYSEKIRPVFDGEYDDFTLTLFNVNYNDTQDDTQDDTQESIEVKIEELIRGNNKISTKEMAEKLNVGVATIKRKIKTMSNLKYIGSGYSGHWELDYSGESVQREI